MNIFVLDLDPVIAAQMQCDKHVVKMVLESAQLLCAPFEPGTAPYKRTHYNHPCALWAREDINNYLWLLAHAYALADEYRYRYGKTHKCLNVIDWCVANTNKLRLRYAGLTPFAQAMPVQYKNIDPVVAYRAYYMGEKMGIAQWTKSRPRPIVFDIEKFVKRKMGA